MTALKRLVLPLFFLALAACNQDGRDSTSQALDAVGNETSASANKVRNYFDVDHKPKPVVAKIQPRYCYKTYEDVICYAKPLPGEEYRLVGFQTASGKTGYTMDPAVVPGGDPDDAKLPPLKTVTVNTPPGVKPDDSQMKEIIFDPAELQPKELVPDKQQ